MELWNIRTETDALEAVIERYIFKTKFRDVPFENVAGCVSPGTDMAYAKESWESQRGKEITIYTHRVVGTDPRFPCGGPFYETMDNGCVCAHVVEI